MYHSTTFLHVHCVVSHLSPRPLHLLPYTAHSLLALPNLVFAFALFVPAVSVLLYHFIFPACKLVFLAFYSKRPCNCFCVLGTSCACPHYPSYRTSFNPLTLQKVESLFETQYYTIWRKLQIMVDSLARLSITNYYKLFFTLVALQVTGSISVALILC